MGSSTRLPPGVAMRRPSGGDTEKATRSGEAVVVPPTSVRVLNRAAFGPRPGDVEAFEALGPTDLARVATFAAVQLDPAAIDDSDLDSRIAAAGYTTLGKTTAQLWTDHFLSGDPNVRALPARELAASTILRAVYSRRGLVEVLADFWNNHFNVFGPSVGAMMVPYDRDVIRPHLLGNYRAMLEAVTKSPAMLIYLDNMMSSAAGPNENFARELCEFHSFGAEHYYGVVPQASVPVDGFGVPLGYVDEDVYEITRCFTGWTLDPVTGEYFYRQEWHDRFQKHVLGNVIPSDQPPEKDGTDVLDLVASNPATGVNIARKLCRRLFADEPPQSVVDQVAALFTAQWQAPDQLEKVVELILLLPDFRESFGQKTKRPFELFASALRCTAAEFHGGMDRPELEGTALLLALAGQRPFTRRSPDGYPDVSTYWSGTTPRAMGLRMLNGLVSVTDSVTLQPWMDVLGQTPAETRSANGLADFWIERILHRQMNPADRREIVDFMAQGRNPDFDLPVDTDPAVLERLKAMVGLVLMSPDFHWR